MYDLQYAQNLDVIAPGVTDIIAKEQAPGESWADTLQRILPIIAATYQQKQLLDVQVQRARDGQPPLDASMYAPGVKVGLSPETMQALYIAGGLLLVVVIVLALKKR